MNARIKYQGDALPAGTAEQVLYDSTLDGIEVDAKWFSYSIVHSHNGTITARFKIDGGAWVQWYTAAITVVSGQASRGELFLEQYQHVQIVWVNGGSTQTQFDVNLALAHDRARVY